jgi:XTP/dITP diphosphohydrolase
MMPKLLLASTNPGKQREIQALLAGQAIDLVTPDRLSLSLDVIEDGATYSDNAALKARAFAETSGLVTLADDSGLEVDWLDGAPGIYSARLAPFPAATDADRRQILLRKLAHFSRPWTARFRCVVALADPQGKLFLVEGICQGEIIPEERGQNGFGYDPIFFIPGLGRTMAELSMTEKNRLSHRARAVQAALPEIRRWLLVGS